MIITICIGSSCHLKGSKEVVHILETLIEKHQLKQRVHLNGSFCLGQCVHGVCVKFNETIHSLTPSTTEEFFYSLVLPMTR